MGTGGSFVGSPATDQEDDTERKHMQP